MSEMQEIRSNEVRTIEVITTEIRVIQKQAQQVVLGYAIELGRRLEEAKQLLPHGKWGAWLKSEVNFSQSTANNFMLIFKEYGASQQSLFGGEANSQTLGNLPYTKALKLLAMPEEEREAFVEENDVAAMSTRELETVIRERDEARQKAERADEAAVSLLKEVDEYSEKLEALKQEADEQAALAAEELEQLREQLEELRSVGKEVAVETVVDESAVKAAADAARAEAEQKLKAKIEKAEKEKKKAEEAKAKAEQDLSALKVAQEESAAVAKREKETMAEQMQALQKKLAVASSSEMTIFKLHFEQGQTSINKMVECVGKMADAGDAEGADKLKNALKALLTATLEVVK